MAHRQRHDLERPRLPRPLGDGFHRGDHARDDDVAGPVVQRERHGSVVVGAETGDDVVVQPDDGGHRPRPPDAGHELRPHLHGPQGGLEVDDAGDVQRGQLAHAVAGDRVRFDALGPEDGGGRHTAHEQRGLGVLGARQLLLRAFPAHSAQVEGHHVGGGLEHRLRLRVEVVQTLSHADALGPLSREQEREHVSFDPRSASPSTKG